jgi:hypothetical protein
MPDEDKAAESAQKKVTAARKKNAAKNKKKKAASKKNAGAAKARKAAAKKKTKKSTAKKASAPKRDTLYTKLSGPGPLENINQRFVTLQSNIRELTNTLATFKNKDEPYVKDETTAALGEAMKAQLLALRNLTEQFYDTEDKLAVQRAAEKQMKPEDQSSSITLPNVDQSGGSPGVGIPYFDPQTQGL